MVSKQNNKPDFNIHSACEFELVGYNVAQSQNLTANHAQTWQQLCLNVWFIKKNKEIPGEPSCQGTCSTC